MMFRQEADKYEVWYSLTDDPNEELKMFIVDKHMTINQLAWWLMCKKDQFGGDVKIQIIREHF